RSGPGCRYRCADRVRADPDGHDGRSGTAGAYYPVGRGPPPRMSEPANVWAIIPVKETHAAKQRLAPVLSAPLRQGLALAMLEDVLEAVTAVHLGGAILVTVDPQATALAGRYGAQTI